jgi:type I restriction enzyme R subunit
VFEGKAMIVGMTRNICVRLYNEIIALKPQWHNVKPIYEALGKASRKYLAFPYRISESSLVVTT